MLARHDRIPTNGRLSFCTVESGSLSCDNLMIDPANFSLAWATTRQMVRACARPVWREHQNLWWNPPKTLQMRGVVTHVSDL